MAKRLDITTPTLRRQLKEYLALNNEEEIQVEEPKIDETIMVSDDNEGNALQVFSNEEFGSVRTVTIDGEPWFIGKDVAAALGYAEPRSAVSKKVESEDRGVTEAMCENIGINTAEIIEKHCLVS